jgi:tetratricopeptide (TPR) repeat protein
MIRNAMGRTPDVDPGAVDLLHAKAKLHEGDTDAAQAFAESAVSLNGDQAEPLLALVEAHFRKLEPMDPDIAEALLSMRREAESTYIGPEVERAIVLALALSNQTDAAFDEGGATTILSDLWQVVGARAEDDAFLRKAVLPSGSPRPDVLPEVGQAVAVRLLALGFPDAALAWLGPATPEDAPPLRLTRATAELQRGDARSALAYLAGIDDPEAIALRAQALFQLGDVAGARDALAQAGEVDAAMRASLWEGDWAELDTAAPEVWRTAADTAQPVPADDTTGLLGRGSKSVEDSRASRDAIDTLLASVPSPVAE